LRWICELSGVRKAIANTVTNIARITVQVNNVGGRLRYLISQLQDFLKHFPLLKITTVEFLRQSPQMCGRFAGFKEVHIGGSRECVGLA
jgi:ABC-type transporter Mla subunit MlaD